jgi:hypothetical protein
MRSLRIGVVIAGQLVEERVFPPTRPITLGQSLRCAWRPVRAASSYSAI